MIQERLTEMAGIRRVTPAQARRNRMIHPFSFHREHLFGWIGNRRYPVFPYGDRQLHGTFLSAAKARLHALFLAI